MRRIMKRTPPVHLVEKPMMTPVAPMRQSMMTIPPMRPAMMALPPMRPAMMALPPMVRRTAMGRTPWCAVGIALTVLRCVLSSINLRTVSCLLVIGKGPPFCGQKLFWALRFFTRHPVFSSSRAWFSFHSKECTWANGKSQPLCQAEFNSPDLLAHICLKW